MLMMRSLAVSIQVNKIQGRVVSVCALKVFHAIFLRQQKRDVRRLFAKHHASSIVMSQSSSVSCPISSLEPVPVVTGQEADPSPVPLSPLFHLNAFLRISSKR